MFAAFDLHSAPPSRPDGFFEKGYVDGSMQQRGDAHSITPENAVPHLSKEAAHMNIKEEGERLNATHQEGFIELGSEEDLDRPDSKNDQASRMNEDEKEKTIPIHSLALLLNASDVTETFTLIENMSTILKKFDIQPEAIYTMQIPQFFIRDASYDWANIIIRGGTIEMNRAIVDQYNIKKVPTWIARTAEGDVVLEGYDDISSFLNAKGELRRKQLERLRQNETESSVQQDILPVVIPASVDTKTAEAMKAATTFSSDEIQKKLKALQESSSSVDISPALQHKEATHEK